MTVEPYLFFEGRCEEALNFYQQAVGAKVDMMMRFGQSPDKSGMPQGADNKILHAVFHIGDARILATDGDNSGAAAFLGFRLAIKTDTVERTRQLFDALAAGGSVTMPLAPTFFSPSFGMLTDKFGVRWVVLTERK